MGTGCTIQRFAHLSDHAVPFPGLRELLRRVLDGQGRVVFATGDAGQGKTALIQEFVRRAQATHPDLIVAGGNGNAHIGIGDPYLPFREVLSLLAGDIEARWTAGAMDREQARRLWHMLPLTVGALVEAGPDLVDTLVSGAALVARVAAMEMMVAGQPCLPPPVPNKPTFLSSIPG